MAIADGSAENRAARLEDGALPGDNAEVVANEPLTVAKCESCKTGGERYNRIWSTPPQREEAHGTLGRLVHKLGVFGYGIFAVIPVVFVAIVHAVIPMGDPTKKSFKENWVFALITNPLAVALFTFLYTAAFLSAANRERPFRQHFAPIFACVLSQIALVLPLVLTVGTFEYLGIASFVFFLLVLYISLRFSYPDLVKECETFFRRFVLLVALYIPILVAYLVAFRESGSGLQSFLNFAMVFITFIYRRVMLSKLDPLPLDIAQLFSGLWVQNMFDSVQTLAFPQVESPGVLVSTWISNSFGNIAFLIFVSDVWIFKIRPPLKNGALNAFKCNFKPGPPPPHDLSFDPVDRGHSPNVGGYRRRQFRYFFFKLMSQAVAMIFYLTLSPMLRYGLNKDLFPFSSSGALVKGEQYQNSMTYAGTNLVFIFMVMFLGYWYLYRRHHATFHEIREIHQHDLANHTRVGLIVAILTCNMIFALGIILSPYCVFSSFRDCKYAAGGDFGI